MAKQSLISAFYPQRTKVKAPPYAPTLEIYLLEREHKQVIVSFFIFFFFANCSTIVFLVGSAVPKILRELVLAIIRPAHRYVMPKAVDHCFAKEPLIIGPLGGK